MAKKPKKHVCYQIVDGRKHLSPEAKVYYQDWFLVVCREELRKMKKETCDNCKPQFPKIRKVTFQEVP